MTMASHGLVKLVEECGELVEQTADLTWNQDRAALPGAQVALANEVADVHAAITFVTEKLALDPDAQAKLVQRARRTLDAVPPDDGGRACLCRVAGYLVQQAAKKISCPDSDEHWDGRGSLAERLTQSMARVIAAAEYLTHTHALNVRAIHDRSLVKVARFRRWDDAASH